MENPTGEFELIPHYAQMPLVNTAKPNLIQNECCLLFVIDKITGYIKGPDLVRDGKSQSIYPILFCYVY